MVVYLNGEWLPAEDACVSVFDRGFMFGDSVYEVVPVYGARPFRQAQHMARLRASMVAAGMDLGRFTGDWNGIFYRLIEDLGPGDGTIYLQVTRGVAPRQHAFPAHVPLTVFAYARRKAADPYKRGSGGISAVVLDDIRWARCDIKSTALIANVLLVQEALRRGADEAILVRSDVVTEGAVSNVFVLKDGVLLTAPCSSFILGGITRDVVQELARRADIPIQERAPTRIELLTADEVLITSSSWEVAAVTQLDLQPVGTGLPGPVFMRLFDAFQAFKDEVRMGTRV